MKNKILLFFLIIICAKGNAQWLPNFQTLHPQIVQVLSSPDDSICWFITNMDTLYKTQDGGQSWSKLPPSNISFNPSGLFVLNKDTAFKNGSASSWKTINGGVTWTNVFSGTGLEAPVIWMKNDSVGVLTFNGQIYKSTNGGNTWSTASISQPPVSILNSSGKGTICNSGDSLWLALRNNGIAYSADYGNTWNVPSNTGLSFSGPGSIYFSNPDFGIAIRANSSFVYVTKDGGVSWAATDNSLGANEDLLAIDDKLWYIPNPADHFYIKQSADSGATWQQQLFDANGFNTLSKSASGNTIWAGTLTGKIYKYMYQPFTGILHPSENTATIKLFPNPFYNYTSISGLNSIDKNTVLTVSDLSGKILFRRSIANESIFIGDELDPGCYLISLFSNSKLYFQHLAFKATN